MKTNQNETNKTNKLEDFLLIHVNVKRCKALDWEERIILSNHISYLRNGQEFFQTDAFQAKELGLSAAQISKYTGRLKERGLIDTRMEYIPNPNGGRPIPKRYVTVIDMDKWITGDKVPAVNKIVSPTKKKQEKKMMGLAKAKTVINSAETTSLIVEVLSEAAPTTITETKLSTKPKSPVKKKKSLEEDLAEAEVKANTSSQNISISNINSKSTNDLITLDAFKDVDISSDSGKVLIAKMDAGEELDFINVMVRFADNELLPDEATKLSNGKYFLKSLLTELQRKVVKVEQE